MTSTPSGNVSVKILELRLNFPNRTPRIRRMGTPRERLIILVAEDDPNDVLLLRRAFHKNGIDHPIHISSDGSDAMAYLQGAGPYAEREKYPFPRAIITDLKMPRCSGFELLEWLEIG